MYKVMSHLPLSIKLSVNQIGHQSWDTLEVGCQLTTVADSIVGVVVYGADSIIGQLSVPTWECGEGIREGVC